MRSHRYRNPRVVLARVDRGRPEGSGMLPPAQSAIDRTDRLAAQHAAQVALAPVAETVGEGAHE